MKKLVVTLALTLLTFLGAAQVASAAPATKPKPSLATGCFYGGYTGPQCAGLPTPANDFDGRVTPPRWDPCPAGSAATLIYLQPCNRMSPTVAQWCGLHFDHHSQVSAAWCKR